jgi:hypothetical protein
MVHVGLHSVATYHKKFGWKKKKIYFAECQRMTFGKIFSVKCLTSDTRQKSFSVESQNLDLDKDNDHQL